MSGLDPWDVGRRHELALGRADRVERGAWYTPRAVAEPVAAIAFDAFDRRRLPTTVLDPTCGGGAFLLAALDQLVARGRAPVEALRCIRGFDSDPAAVVASRRAVEVWAGTHGVEPPATLAQQIVVADALDPAPAAAGPVDLVLGNPPFATPLKGSPLPVSAHRLRLDNAALLGPYADLAAVHLLAASRHVRSGGVVSMLLPQSVLSGRDCAGLRAHFDRQAPLVGCWASAEQHFDANVRVWAPVLKVDGPVGSRSWAEAVASALGFPAVRLSERHGRLGDLADTTAGFRDEYYAMADVCVEGDSLDERPRVVTVGSIDPLECSWGRRPIRFAKRQWHRPVVDPAEIDGSVGRWVERQLVPKVLLPTQSKVFEPFVDREGVHLPVTPLLALHADPADLDRVAAVLLAPPVVAWAHRRWFGAALSVDAIKLAARDVAALPLPREHGPWSEAAALIAEGPGAVPEIGRLMAVAYDADAEVVRWWRNRLPRA